MLQRAVITEAPEFPFPHDTNKKLFSEILLAPR